MKRAVVFVDIQNDFCPATSHGGGRLAVADGDAAIHHALDVLSHRLKFDGELTALVFTQDWHPPDHLSFASQHAGRKPFDQIALGEVSAQTLWPDHCVQGTNGAEFALCRDSVLANYKLRGDHLGLALLEDLQQMQNTEPSRDLIELQALQSEGVRTCVIRKGFRRDVDSYSAFLENDQRHRTPLASWLHSLGVEALDVMGLATDYCVRATCIDAAREGFQVRLDLKGSRAVDPSPAVLDHVLADLRQVGVQLIEST